MESKNATVQAWLDRLGRGSKKSYARQFARFMDFVRINGGAFKEMDPDDLVKYQKESDNGTKYDVLDLVQRYVGSKHGRLSSKKTVYAILKSFFAHNRAELPRDPRFIMRGDVEKVVGKLTISDIQQMILSANKCYRAIFLSMFQGGMDTASLLYWSNNGLEDLKEQLRGDPEVLKIGLPGRKKRRNSSPFFTLIGRDAIKAVRDWMKVRPEGHSQIFLTRAFLDKEKGIRRPVSSKSLKMYWLKYLDKIGLIERGGDSSKRYGMNLHEMRDVFRSQWEKSPAKGSVAEFMMGHQVDPLEYNKAHRDEKWVKKEYLNALPMLQIMTSARPFGKVEEDEFINLQEKVKDLEARLERSTRELYLERVEAQRDLAEHQEDISRVKTELKRLFAEVEILKDKPAHAAEI